MVTYAPRGMELVTWERYHEFVRMNDSVPIANYKVRLIRQINSELSPPEYTPEETTVWSFPDRGEWATHRGDYPGNWSPYVPRNLLDKYTRSGDLVCDPMMGSGTTLVECKLMGRAAIGVDVNLNACMIAMNRLDFPWVENGSNPEESVCVYHGDARKLNALADNTVDLVTIHPPYANIIDYSGGRIPGDISVSDIDQFVQEMNAVARECFRVLKPSKHCAVMVGDTRRKSHYVPLHIGVLSVFLAAGFILKEDIIKLQHATRSSREAWLQRSLGFYKIAHEHLYVLRKENESANSSDYQFSRKWW